MGYTTETQEKGEVENMDAPLDNKLKTYWGGNDTYVKQPENNAKQYTEV